MKIIVLHGEDTEKTYDRLKKFIETARARSWEVVSLDESDLPIKENLSSRSLFGGQRFFILRDIKKLTKVELAWLDKNRDLPGNLIICHEGQLGKLVLKALPRDTKVEEFPLPKLIWAFLDHITPGNSKKVVLEFHKLIEREPAEFIFSLISKLFRDLYWLVTDKASLPYESWRVGKLTSQARNFDADTLKKIIEKLSQIDIDTKTGKAELVSSLDLLFIKYLQ